MHVGKENQLLGVEPHGRVDFHLLSLGEGCGQGMALPRLGIAQLENGAVDGGLSLLGRLHVVVGPIDRQEEWSEEFVR